MNYDTAGIRQFLFERFSDEELKQLCFDYFTDVYHDFSSGMRKSQMVQLLLEHCQSQGRFPALLAAIERERPEQYQSDFPTSPPLEIDDLPNSSSGRRETQQVFISYAHQDAAFAHRLAADLRRHQVPVWITPGSIQPGEKWVEAINRGLAESGVFLLALTPHAANSRWVQNETNVAIELDNEGQMTFIPLLVEAAELPPLWRVYQHIPFAGSYEYGLRSLLDRLGAAGQDSSSLGDRPSAPETPEEEIPSPGLPTWAWGVIAGAVILLAFALWQILPDVPGETTASKPDDSIPGTVAAAEAEEVTATTTAIAAATTAVNPSDIDTSDVDLYPGFVESQYFKGEIRLGQTVSVDRKGPGSRSDTWLFRDGPATVNITLEGSAGVDFILRIYGKLSLDWDEPLQRGYVDFTSGPGEELTFFEIPDDGDYAIAVLGSREVASSYQLSVVEAVPQMIGLGQTVEGQLMGDNPGVYLFNGGPAVIDVSLQVGVQDIGLIIIFDADGNQLEYYDVMDSDGLVQIGGFEITDDAEYTIVVRDTTNDGTNFKLTVDGSPSS